MVQVPLFVSIGAYGVAIIAMTILIRLVLAPLQQFQLVTQRKTMVEQRKLAPQVNEIRKKYKKDPQKVNAEMMKLYQEHGVNPLGGLVGCLPLVVQMPILYALYWVFRGRVAPLGWPPHFLFIPNLNDFPNHHAIVAIAGFAIPAVPYLVFPLLAAATTYVSTKMLQQPTPVNPTEQELQTLQIQRTMVVMSPLLFGWFALQSPAGLALYWFIGNCVAIIQQYFVVGWGNLWPRGGTAPTPITQPKGAGPPKNGGGPGNAKQLPRRVQGGGGRKSRDARDAKRRAS
ncbi:MAG TPA: YidC/Oxa1 family membrane protein insertase [Candidatus Dormibacteraeota bacterium]|nr:YidC/Oxa1 family membrane protein insertase [Candidatus Dormibacteraeota bacterium]